MSDHTTELEAWHARYDQAIREGRSIPDAVVAADTTPEVAAAIKRERDHRDGLYVPVQVRPIEVRVGPWIGPPDESAFEPVFLSPDDLRRAAERKRAVSEHGLLKRRQP